MSQLYVHWAFPHKPFGNSQNTALLQKQQLILSPYGNLIAGWQYYIADSGYLTLGISSYTKDGILNWEREYHGSIGSDNDLYNILIDSIENVYAVGEVNINNAHQDNVILKYDSTGALLWQEEDDSISSRGRDAVLLNDNLYMLSAWHPGLYKYDSNGSIVDTIKIDSSGTGNSGFGSIVESKGNIYYGGFFTTIGNTNSKLYASKMSANDSVEWKTIVEASSHYDEFVDIAADESGNVFLLANANGVSDSSYTFVCGIDGNSGDTMWTNQLPVFPEFPSYPCFIKTDRAGHVYVTTNVYDSSGWYKTKLIQYDAINGNENWVITLDSTAVYWIKLPKIEIDTTTNDIYLAYNLIPNSSLRTSILKISPAGIIGWQYWFNSLGPVEGFIYDQNNNFYIAGTYVAKLGTVTNLDELELGKGSLLINYLSQDEKVHVKTNKLTGRNYRIAIYDAIGRMIYLENGGVTGEFNFSIPFYRKENGIYILSLETEKELLSGKFIVY